MNTSSFGSAALDTDALGEVIREEYTAVAEDPGRGFHFHTGRALAERLGYEPAWLDALPASTLASFAGTGNPFRHGSLQEGEHVVDLGSGAGVDSLTDAAMVGPNGSVTGIDLTPAMVVKARRAARSLNHVRFELGSFDDTPLPDHCADVIISNGVLNLVPDKHAAFAEMRRLLRPGGRLQIADILVARPVGDGAKRDPRLWAG
ncbi:MAG: methyltransferase domain-containing protein [Planctomycetota bacterium]